jgi:hypothetical protein
MLASLEGFGLLYGVYVSKSDQPLLCLETGF